MVSKYIIMKNTTFVPDITELWGHPAVIRKCRAEYRKWDEDNEAYFLQAASFQNPMSFPSAAEPNICLNEEAAEHDNVILVQAHALERNKTEWKVELRNETRTSLNQVKK